MRRLSGVLCRRPWRRGASAIEFALTLPLLAFFLMAVIEYGWYFWQLIAMTNAVRDALRVAVIFPVDGTATDPYADPVSEAETRVQTLLASFGIDPATSGSAECKIEAVPNDSGGAGTWTLTLRACLEYEPLTLNLVPVPDTIAAEMTMLLEDQS